jgi:hypothetical protein
MEVESFIFQEHLDDMDDAQLRFILDHAEKQLKESLSIGDQVVTRTTSVLTITSGLIIGLAGYSINRWDLGKADPLFWSASLSIAYLIVPLILMCSLIIPTSYSLTGSPPKPFFSDDFFNEDTTKSNRLSRIYASEIVNYEARIISNLIRNQNRWKRYTTAFLLTAVSPVAFILLYLISSFLSQ